MFFLFHLVKKNGDGQSDKPPCVEFFSFFVVTHFSTLTNDGASRSFKLAQFVASFLWCPIRAALDLEYLLLGNAALASPSGQMEFENSFIFKLSTLMCHFYRLFIVILIPNLKAKKYFFIYYM